MSGAGRGEFDIIARYFAPLARGAPGALGLLDDGALVDVAPGNQLVAVTDAVVAGIHFFADDPPGDIARKVVRVNLSDLAAMGARPRAMLLCAVLPQGIDDNWLAEFASGLAADVESFQVPLVGGDTVATNGPLTLTVTALGEVRAGAALTRAGAVPGDGVWVSGTVGDAALGLALAGKNYVPASENERDYLLDRYRRPRPRLEVGQGLVGLAHACIDISDGLVADLGHILSCSGVGAAIRAGAVPLSPPVRDAVRRDPELLGRLLVGGDDYELVFTAPLEKEAEIAKLSGTTGVDLVRIGHITVGPNLEITDAAALSISTETSGFKHFG